MTSATDVPDPARAFHQPPQFTDWIEGERQQFDRAWVRDGDMPVYLRLAFHTCGHQGGRNTLDIAAFGGDGEVQWEVFKPFLERAEAAAKAMGRAVYLETIGEDKLIGFLVRRGYVEFRSFFARGTRVSGVYPPVASGSSSWILIVPNVWLLWVTVGSTVQSSRSKRD